MLKFFPKILIIFFLIIFIFQLACLLFLTLAPSVSQAADPATFKPQVQIPGMDQADAFGAPDSKGAYAIPGSTASIAKYIKVIYKYAIGIVGILAAVVLMIGGVMWIVAGGSATVIGEAKAWIGASLTGLLLALLSYLILATVNPALVDFAVTPVQTITETKTQSTLKENDPCVLNQAPYCSDGLECKNGKCVITNERTAQCQESHYAWTESTNCDGPTYSDNFCSCKSGKTNITNKCCTPKFTSTTPSQSGCCEGVEITSGQYSKKYLCASSPQTTKNDCTFITNKGPIFGNFYLNKICKTITTIYGTGENCQ